MAQDQALKAPGNRIGLIEIASRYGTPTYVYSEKIIRDRISTLTDHLQDLPFQLSYACKANTCPSILNVFYEEGLGIDAVSPAELEIALRVGFPKEQILYSANNMTDEEMSSVYETGVTLNIGELSRLVRFGQTYPGSPVCIRLNPQVGAGHHHHVITAGADSKFGIPVEQIPQIRDVLEQYGLKLIGLHQHIGSGILDTDVLRRAISVMLESAKDFRELEFINLGGGLGVPYRPEEQPLDFESWDQKIVRPLKKYLDSHPADDLRFVFEPGRYFVAEAGSLLVRVNTIKNAGVKTFAGVDSGMGHLARPAMYGSYHAIYNLSNPDGPLGSYDVVGNICESADFFARDREVQEIREGDLLCIMDAGAYGMSMASVYNARPLPAEVWIPASTSEPELVSTRESTTEFVDRLYPALGRS